MLYRIRPFKNTNFDLFEYLNSEVGSEIFSQQLDRIMKDGIVQAINKKDLLELKIPSLSSYSIGEFYSDFHEKFDIKRKLQEQILEIPESLLEDQTIESLIEVGWKKNEIKPAVAYSCNGGKFIPDITLYDENQPIAFIEVKGGTASVNKEMVQRMKWVQKTNNLLAILSVGGLYFEVYKLVNDKFFVYKFQKNPSKKDLLEIMHGEV